MMGGKAGMQHLRLRIAQRAAQLMIDGGIRDYALAKRKAAHQLGIDPHHGLPSNEEVDAALMEHRALFDHDAHGQELLALRRQALVAMQRLDRFGPLLTGGVVSGAVSPHSDIEVELYADSSKAFEQFLLNADIAFKTEERPGCSIFLLFGEPANVQVRVLPPQALHSRRGGREEARKCLTVTQLRHLLEDTPD